MIIREIRVLEGANYWSRFPVVEAWVDLQERKDQSSDEMPGFNDRLMAWLPTLIEHRCSVGTRGGFFERLRRGTYLAHILEHVSLELQTLAGSSVGFGRARETNIPGLYRVAVCFEIEPLARLSLELGRELCLAAVCDRPFDVSAAVDRLQEVASQFALPEAAQTLLADANSRKIPVVRHDPLNLQLGYGRLQRERIVSGQVVRPMGHFASVGHFASAVGHSASRGHAGPPWAPSAPARLDGVPQPAPTDPLDNARIPIVAIAEGPSGRTLAHMIQRLLSSESNRVAVASAEGVLGEEHPNGDGQPTEYKHSNLERTGWFGAAARQILSDATVDAAILHADANSILRSGLIFDLCDVGVVTRLEPLQQPGMEWVDEPEYMIRIQRSVVEAVAPTGTAVLNAAHEEVAEMADACAGDVILFAAADDHPCLRDHRQRGGRTVSLRDQVIVLATGTGQTETIPAAIAGIGRAQTLRSHDTEPANVTPALDETKLDSDPFLETDHLLAAVGAAWALLPSIALLRAAWKRLSSQHLPRTKPAGRRVPASASPALT